MNEVAIDPQRAVQELIDELVSALMNARVYFAAHPRVHLSIEQLARSVAALAKSGREQSLRFAVAGGYVLFENRPVIGASLAAGRLIEILARVGAGGIELAAGSGVEEIKALVETLSARVLEAGSYKKLNAQLSERVHDRVRLLPPFRANDEGASGAGSCDGLEFDGDQLGVDANDRVVQMPTRLYQGVLGMLQDVTVTACQGGTIPMGTVATEAENLLKELDQASGPLMSLASQHEYDAFTLGHSMRVTVLAMDFARGLGADRATVMSVGVAGLLHDVGKAKVPFEILHSRRPLTNEEREVVNSHPEHGARILLDHDKVEPFAVASAFGHHRRFDGDGYPRTMHEHQTSVTTRVVKICDVYEALTAARPYKPPMSAIRAYRIMISMRGHFDGRLLHRFIHRNGVYANGSQVRLDTGERAFVMQQSSKLLLPRVMLVSDRDGNDLPWNERSVIDLSRPGVGVKVVGNVTPGAPAPLEPPPAATGTVEGCCGPIATTGEGAPPPP
jgi:putative nucleotidyltransferase with HDIG domain